jgi:cyclopropane fatty-acyl-phospholipid synthase-like methyltransferase
MPLSVWYDSLKDRRCIASQKLPNTIPPASLRYRVQGNGLLKDFLDMAKHNFEEIKIALERINCNLDSFENILDFACGSGRTAIWFHLKNETNKNELNLYGTDIDGDAIKWCQENLASGKFSINKELPPLEYQDNFFDLIYAISVFTHMKEYHQLLWLQELRRILKLMAYYPTWTEIIK